jgi:hypothetical protein
MGKQNINLLNKENKPLGRIRILLRAIYNKWACHCGVLSIIFSLSSFFQYAIMPSMITCHACKKELSISRNTVRKETCPSCGADLHCCLNCSFFDSHVSKQCREPAAELVSDKSRANYCDFFAFADSRPTDQTAGDAVKDARRALERLFKK